MINFGDRGLIVQYIQNFLKDNYDKNIHLSDEYDKDTHKALINYLKLPEILDSLSMKDLIIKHYTFREINPPNLLLDGGGIWNFDFDITPNMIRFYTRPVSKCLSNGLMFISKYIDDIDLTCRAYGWYVENYTTFTYIENTNLDKKAEIILKQEDRKQILPSHDIINMINFSTNDYLLNKCFLDENNSYHGFIQDSKFYKISLIEAKAGETYTISHGYEYPCEIAIGYTDHTLKEIKEEGYMVNNIVSYMSNSVNGMMKSGNYHIYHIPENSECKYLLIQLPFTNVLLDSSKEKITIKLGDIDLDGKITESDYNIIKQYVENKEKFSDTKLNRINLMAANLNNDVDIYGNPVVDKKDLNIFKSALENPDNKDLLNFGEVTYENKINLHESQYDKLLVIYGNIEEDNKGNELNIPIYEFQSTPWAIHDEFLPYILGSVIHKYSDIEDILWLQNRVREFNSDYLGLRAGYYDSPEDYLINEYIIWNDDKLLYEYHKNGMYTGYVLDNTINILNAKLRRESDMTLSPIEIVNGRWIFNGEWTGALVLSNGRITKEHARNSLKEIIKKYQLQCNSYYKYQNTELIKFINGYVNPLTEKWLDLM